MPACSNKKLCDDCLSDVTHLSLAIPPHFLEVGPASMVVGNLVAGKRIAQASGRELSHLEDSDQARKVRAGGWREEGPPWRLGSRQH